jgi:tetratricopeptide (TPR) repeat protein
MPSTLEHPTKMETTQTRSFVRTVLPWIVAAVMLLLYFFTRNTYVTAESVWPLARANGMNWQAPYIAPLTYLVTFPVRWFPPGMQLLVLNLISVICAAVSLGLLARSVAILPHDRTQLQREKRIDENGFLGIRLAWVPVIFAVIVAGLQLSFWEHAIVGTGEMIDLLLFAYCVRCLLEYRIEEKNSWLYRLAVVYGVGITNNFAMIAFFPALLIALVWVKGWRFFRFNFLVTMFLLGLAGLAFYFVLPLINLGEASFWTSLKTNLAYQKEIVFGLRKAALLPTLCFAVPLMLIGFRWTGGFGDQSAVGSMFANLAAVVLHAGILAFCVFVAFDSKVTPREVAEQYRETGVRFSFLPVYYLSALLVGYYSGFLLLVFSKSEPRSRRRTTIPPALNYAVAGLVCAGAAFAAVSLFGQNFRKIQKSNSAAHSTYASEIAKSLPEKPAVIFSDDPVILYPLHAALDGKTDHLLLEAVALTRAEYHKYLQKRHGARMPKVELFPGEKVISSPQNLQALHQLSATRDLIYVHPSFGYFFEAFYLEPRKLVHVLKQYPVGAITPPPLAAEVITAQGAYWASLQNSVLKDLKAELDGVTEELKARLETTPGYVGICYSRALDHWGVELQKAGRFDEAAPMFAEALALNPNNAAALINISANALWRKEKRRLPKMTEQEEQKLGLYQGNVTYLFNACGPIDEPTFLTELANNFTQNTLYRQAQQMLMRGLDYVPDDVALRLSLANVHVLAQQPDIALSHIKEMRERPGWTQKELPVQIEVSRLEASALLVKNEFAAAERLLKSLVQAHSNEPSAYYALSQLYSSHSARLRDQGEPMPAAVQSTNALDVIEALLQKQPTNTVAWFTCGNLAFYTGNYDRSIEAFSKVLQQTRQNKAALLNRAVSYLRSAMTLTNEAKIARLRSAKGDYEDYKRQFGPDYRVYFGLAEIAYAEQDWRMARENYEHYLQYGGTASATERKLVQSRLEEVKKKT